jgi:hypothetical protein
MLPDSPSQGAVIEGVQGRLMSQPAQQNREDTSRRRIGRWAGWWLRAAPWPLLLLALALMVGYFWVYRSPTVAMVGLAYYFDFCLGSFLFGLLAAGRGVQLAVRNVYEARFGLQSGVCRSRRWFWPWLLLIAASTYIMLWSRLPMHLSFLLSRPALDRLADAALNDPANAHLLAGRWAGLYPIDGVEVIGNTVVLYLGKDKGNYGFARVPKAKDDQIFNMPGQKDGPHYQRDFPKHDGPNDPMGKRITEDWFVMYSAYWLVKVGWS